jgi:hypothetical protein
MKSQSNVKFKQMNQIMIIHVHQQSKSIHYLFQNQRYSKLILQLKNTNVKRVKKDSRPQLI